MSASDDRPDEARFREMIARFDRAVQELALEARGLIFDVLPGAFEVVWPHQGTAGYGTGPRKMSEHFAYLTFAKSHVGLGFYYGAELPDPVGLLEGSGKLMRRVKIERVEQLRDPALRELVRAATTHRVPPLPEEGR